MNSVFRRLRNLVGLNEVVEYKYSRADGEVYQNLHPEETPTSQTTEKPHDTGQIIQEIDDILTELRCADGRIEENQASIRNLKVETQGMLTNLQVVIELCGKDYTNSESNF
jgi:hypothetical protein